MSETIATDITVTYKMLRSTHTYHSNRLRRLKLPCKTESDQKTAQNSHQKCLDRSASSEKQSRTQRCKEREEKKKKLISPLWQGTYVIVMLPSIAFLLPRLALYEGKACCEKSFKLAQLFRDSEKGKKFDSVWLHLSTKLLVHFWASVWYRLYAPWDRNEAVFILNRQSVS